MHYTLKGCLFSNKILYNKISNFLFWDIEGADYLITNGIYFKQKGSLLGKILFHCTMYHLDNFFNVYMFKIIKRVKKICFESTNLLTRFILWWMKINATEKILSTGIQIWIEDSFTKWNCRNFNIYSCLQQGKNFLKHY